MFDPKAVAVVGVGAIMPDAENVDSFWKNVLDNRYSISEVPANRWSADLYYDPDPSAIDKTYSKIGGWVRSFTFEPLKWGIPIPPSVLAVMDNGQKWGIASARQALLDYGYPQKPLNQSRVAVILGNALAGENHYLTSLRIHLPDFITSLTNVEAFRVLPKEVREALVEGVQEDFRARIANITEDTMPGELGNIIAGRIANVFNFAGPNFVTDAACASSLAALQAAVDGLVSCQFDAVLTGGVDRNMGVEGFVKFCKIGALSPDGSRPFAEGANGFVMGEGTAIFLLKRLADAERDGDQIYAVIRGIGSSSDGKGKGITAPNPLGQQRAIERAWKNAGVTPASVGLIEAHGTSTRVGDVVEVNSLNAIFEQFSLPPRQIALGSVKSNIGHLKSAAGGAGMLKAVLALHTKTLPPSANFHKPNPEIDFDHIPFYVNTEACPWENQPGEIRRAGVSSFGFGGTNFHLVMEEWVPGLLTSKQKIYPGFEIQAMAQPEAAPEPAPAVASFERMATYRGVLFLGAASKNELKTRLQAALDEARNGKTPERIVPDPATLRQPERIAIDFGDAPELIKRAEKALVAFDEVSPNTWQALSAQGVYRGSGAPGKMAFLFPGQGSQYVNMLKDLCEFEPVVADTFKEADRIMTPILGRPLTSYIYVEGDEESLKQAEAALRDTAITQPAMLTADIALLRLMNQYGYTPDLVVGHSLGEYAALVAAEVLTFAEALEVVSARGREMKKVSVADNGCMAAVSAPIEQIQKTLSQVDSYVVLANINSPLQSVIGGNTQAVETAIKAFEKAGYQATKISVSHAFHTRIVAPASEPLKRVIERMNLQAPKIPVVANVTGGLYPTSREEILDYLARQVASPVQFIQGMQTLYDQGARVFVEVGPKRVLNALANDNYKDKSDVILLATNHPRKGAVVSFNEALCGLYAAGVLYSIPGSRSAGPAAHTPAVDIRPAAVSAPSPKAAPVLAQQVNQPAGDGRLPLTGSVVVSGAGLGLPGRKGAVFSDQNIEGILKGEIRIEPLPEDSRRAMVDKRVTRLEKSDAGAQMVHIDRLDLTVKLAGQRGSFDLVQDFGVPAERADACDITTQLAIAAGIEALRDAGIPLVMSYRRTSKGTYLPDRWRLPEALRDETGVIFASAFPGLDRMAEEADRFYQHRQIQAQLEEIQRMMTLTPEGQSELSQALSARTAELEEQLKEIDYHFDRRFVFRVLAMGHSQFAEYIGARGPNTHVNAACATTTHAIAIAEDWIRSGRCRRVVIIAGDDVTSPNLAGWIGTGLLASGATTIEEDLRLAALPFDRRRNGMVMGMGAAALVVESEDAVRERGMKGICEILATEIANSAFHGTRLDVPHVSEVMDRLVAKAEQHFGVRRNEIAARTMFMSHETYTPARGGSASAEIHALRDTFGEAASRVIIANTKGYTGHAMGVGIEDVVSIKALETGIVPPIAHYDEQFEPDPELGDLNLSRGGEYPIRYALRLGAGFGSQVAMALFRVIPGVKERVAKDRYENWLAQAAGYEQAELEVVQRTLRIRHAGPPIKEPAKSIWQFGQGPTLWADRTEEVAPAIPTQAAVAPKPAEAPAPAPGEQPVQSQIQAAPEEIQAFVLQQVAEKTGYPPEMLDLDLDLEADLGIDTVKQAELFAAIREHYQIPRREDLRLVEYNTLAKVIQFMQESLPAGTAAPAGTPQAETGLAQPAPAAPFSGGPHREAVEQYVLSVVSEKTGYPPEMLDMDLDLEADLGIDTVKQAELFAAVRSNYDIPRREDLRLVEYNTLAKVVAFVQEALNGQASAPTAKARMEAEDSQPQAAPEVEMEADQTNLTKPVEEVVPVICRRIPAPVLRPRLDLCVPTGVKLEESVKVLVVADRGKSAESLARRLRGRKVQVFLTPPQPVEQLLENLKLWQSTGPIQGIYYLPGLDPEPDLNEHTPESWQQLQEERLVPLYHLLREIHPDPFLICATRLGGLHGYDKQKPPAPSGGAISGFAKAIQMERAETFVKVVDFGADDSAARVAAHLIEETLNDPGAVEIGWRGELRFAIAVVTRPIQDESFDLGEKPVFMVTGGSAGISAPVVIDLAQRTQGSFYLLSRTPLPAADEPDLLRLRSDREGLKKDWMRKIGEDGKKMSPAQIEKRLDRLERAAATLEAIRTVEQAGGKARTLVCDVTNAEQVEKAVQTIAKETDRVDVVLHLAAFEHSRRLESKPLEEFNATIAVKVNGFFYVHQALRKHQLQPKAWVMFSSVAGRFGNAGQTDYSAANDWLCKLCAALNAGSDGTKAIAIDWGAWSDVGMSTRGYIPELMKRAGIEMISPDIAAPWVYRELTGGKTGGEVILSGSLGRLETLGREDGGLDLDAANRTLTEGKSSHVMLSRLAGLRLHEGILLEAELDPDSEPFLRDHALNGIPLLPGVMGIEGFAAAARHIASSIGASKGGFEVTRLEDIQFLAPFKFYRNQKRRVAWKAQVVYEEGRLVAYVVLESKLAARARQDKIVQHFSGKVFLEPVGAQQEKVKVKPRVWNGAYTVEAADIYRLYFHGPSFQVLEGVQRLGDRLLGKMNTNLPPFARNGQSVLTSPLLIELCLQTAGIWEAGVDGALALPRSIRELNFYQAQPQGEPMFAEVIPGRDEEDKICFDARVFDAKGQLYLEMHDYRTSRLPYSVDEKLLKPLKDLVETE